MIIIVCTKIRMLIQRQNIFQMLDSTLQMDNTSAAPLQGTQQMGSNISLAAVNTLSMLSSEDLHHLLHLAQHMKQSEMANTAGALAPAPDG